MKYKVEIDPFMRQVASALQDECVGVPACISGHGESVIVEVPKHCVADAVAALKKHFRDVVDIRKAYLMIEDLHDYILVKPMTSESPLLTSDGFASPSLEKRLVDLVSDKENAALEESFLASEYQHSFEVYDVNLKKMLRYAARKGEREQVQQRVERLDHSRIELIRLIQRYLSGSQVDKAWIFGSYSRMEERPDSDIDILFSVIDKSRFSLIDHAAMKVDLENLLGRKVDLVVEGSLLPFAVDSVNNDKYLIYART